MLCYNNKYKDDDCEFQLVFNRINGWFTIVITIANMILVRERIGLVFFSFFYTSCHHVFRL